MDKKAKLVLLFSCLTLLMFFSFKYTFWLFASKNEFINWYPNFGSILWWLKNVGVLIISIFLLFLVYYQFKNNNVNIIISSISLPLKFIGVYFFLLLFFKGNHPFTMVNMYSDLDDQVNYFYIDDCKGNLIPLNHLCKISGGELSHYYYNFKNNNSIPPKDIGILIWDQLKIDEREGSCLCLFRQPLSEKIEKEKLYSTCE